LQSVERETNSALCNEAPKKRKSLRAKNTYWYAKKPRDCLVASLFPTFFFIHHPSGKRKGKEQGRYLHTNVQRMLNSEYADTKQHFWKRERERERGGAIYIPVALLSKGRHRFASRRSEGRPADLRHLAAFIFEITKNKCVKREQKE
jgi:hypothetical protein